MNILLIYPEYPDTFWSFKYALKFVAKKAAFPPLGLLTVAALLRSIWQLGIKSKARVQYWKLVARTLLLKRKAVPMAIELAIIGQHFEQILQRLDITRTIDYNNN